MTKQLLTADLHLTDSPADEYRWSLFEWLHTQYWDELWILGDMTDRKDRHSAILVNRIVDVLRGLVKPVHIVKGNHDCVDPANPFFRFLDHFRPQIHYHTDPTIFKNLAILPFYPSIDRPWERWPVGWPVAKQAIFHGTVTGAKAENGQLLSGVPPEAFKQYRKVWAGDIHVPQQVGNVEYVGAPYHIHFGDTFTPRLVCLTDWENPVDLHFTAPIQKLLQVITSQQDVKELEKLPTGTQVKVRIVLPPERAADWHLLRAAVEQIAHANHLNLHGIELVTDKAIGSTQGAIEQRANKTDNEIVHEYGKLEKLSDSTIEVGEAMLDED